MGAASLLANRRFVNRREVDNQRSFLNDHISYFQNPRGFLPVLWQLLAPHSRLRLFRDVDTARVKRLLWIHHWQSLVLRGSGMASWAALIFGLWALRHSLAGLGASVQTALDGLGLGALVKPLQAISRVVVWIGDRAGLTGTLMSADDIAAALWGALSLGAAMIGWWALFRSAWVMRAAADWRRACLETQLFGASGERAWDIAKIMVWLSFGAVPLLLAVMLVFAPSVLTVQSLSHSVVGIVAMLGIALALLYAIGPPWILQPLTGTLELELRSVRIVTPAASLFLVAVSVFGVRWIWPPAWSPSIIDGSVAAVWLGMALSWGVWLLVRGPAVFGWFTTAVLLLSPLVASEGITRLWVPYAELTDRLVYLNSSGVGMVTVALIVQERGNLMSIVREFSGARRLIP